MIAVKENSVGPEITEQSETKSLHSKVLEETEQPVAEKVPFKQRCKSFFITHKAKLIKFSIVLCLVAAFSTGCYFLFDWLGLLDKETARATMDKYGLWVYVIFVVVFVLASVCLCMIPGTTTTLILVAVGTTAGNGLFGNIWIGLLLSVIGVWIAGIVMFYVGRFGGRKVVYWLFGKEQVEKRLDWVTQKGATVLPAFFLIPFMPNDMICMVCGMSKLKFWQFLLIIFPFRIIEVLIILSYTHLVKIFITGRSTADILIFINIVIIDILLIALYYRALIRIFRKYFLRKKYVIVEKPYTVEEEVKSKKKQ